MSTLADTQPQVASARICHKHVAPHGTLVSFLFLSLVIAAISEVDALLWRDVKQYSPQNIFRNRFGEVARIPLQTVFRQNCTIDRYSKSAAGISGYGCRQIPPLEPVWNVSQVFVHHTAVSALRPGGFVGRRIRRLELSQNKITSIEPNAFMGLELVEFLGLNENPISYIRVGAFRGLWQLRELVLFHTRVQYWSSLVPALVDLPRLELLDLGFTPITKLDETDLEPLQNSTLAYLSLRNCGSLTSIHPRAFSHLGNLVGLFLKDDVNLVSSDRSFDELLQMIGNLTQPSFRVIDVSRLTVPGRTKQLFQKIADTGIEVIMLSQSLREITKDTFPLMPNITSLVIPLAKMPIEKYGLSTLPNLREIAFQRSFMPDFPEGMALPQIEYIDISGFDRNPQVLELPENIFRNMSHLLELNMRHRAIPDLSSATFEGLIALKLLDMGHCHITYLPVDVFKPLVSLTYLDLTGNAIFAVVTAPKDIFAPLRNLRHLSLSLTAAEWFSTDTFDDLANLEVLNLNNNSLTAVPDLSSNKKLHTLDVSGNQLHWFEQYELGNGSHRNRLPASLTSLDLSNNEITYHVKVPPTVRHLNLSNNPFMCECDLKPLLYLMRRPNLEVVNLEFESLYECARPRRLQGSYIVRVGRDLERSCQPHLIIIVAVLVIALLVAVILMVGALIYRERFKAWLDRYHYERYTNQGEGGVAKSYEFDAFVSYSSHDVHFVINDLLPRLEELKKLKLCVYDRDFLAGKSITDCVLDSMKKSRKIIIILSDHFLQSPWCKFETDLAQFTTMEENRDSLILVKIAPIDESMISGKLSYLLRTRVHLDYSTLPRDKFFSKLAEAVKQDRPRYQRFRRNMSVMLKGRKNQRSVAPAISPDAQHQVREQSDVAELRDEAAASQENKDDGISRQTAFRSSQFDIASFQSKPDLSSELAAEEVALASVSMVSTQLTSFEETSLRDSTTENDSGITQSATISDVSAGTSEISNISNQIQSNVESSINHESAYLSRPTLTMRPTANVTQADTEDGDIFGIHTHAPT